jgi:hypothetical protein
MMYGMQKTTVYLPDDIKRALAIVAKSRNVSEAELIREALQPIVAAAQAQKPKLPLFKSGKPHLAENLEEALSDFGT